MRLGRQVSRQLKLSFLSAATLSTVGNTGRGNPGSALRHVKAGSHPRDYEQGS
jgi:hypothetical protein